VTPRKRALIFAPWAAPVVFCTVTALAVAAGVAKSDGGGKVVGTLAHYSLLALKNLALAYPATVLVGWPLGAWLRRRERVRPRAPLVVGALTGIVFYVLATALITQRGVAAGRWAFSGQFLGELLTSALSGAAVALVYWWIVLRRPVRD